MFLGLSATGYFGKLTQTAVQSWQRSHNIVSSGKPATTGYGAVGKKTRAALAICTKVSLTTPPSPPPAYAQGSYGNGGGGSYAQGTYFSQSSYTGGGYSQGTYYAQGSYTTCTPDSSSPQTKALTCPVGQSGSITQTRTSTCAASTTVPTWSTWATTTNSCVTAGISYSASVSQAISDLYKNYWNGERSTGHLLNNWTGVPGEQSASHPRGALWPYGSFIDTVYMDYRAAPTSEKKASIQSEWNRITYLFNDAELASCGAQSQNNFGADDTGWNAATFLQIYDVTSDSRALDLAKTAVGCGLDRWQNSQLGGLWYNDDKNTNSLYDIGLSLDAFRIYELTSDSSFLARARSEYDWIESTLKRSDSVYWNDYGWWEVPGSYENKSTVAPHPLGVERPNDIHLAGSVSSLVGMMGIDVMHARMYRLTGEDLYKQRVNATAQAMLSTFVDSAGGFLDDRDAWADGHFAREWIIEAYPLLSSDLQQKARAMFAITAKTIAENARTADGFYNGAWGGPAINSAWDKAGSAPQQIMTSAQAVMMLLGPELIDANLPQPVTPKLTAPIVSATLLGQTGEDYVGPTTKTPSGVKDVHIRLTNVTTPISAIDITGATTGRWRSPPDGSNWIASVQPESDPTVVDVFFEFYQTNPSYSLAISFANGTAANVVTTQAQTATAPTGALLGQTGEDFVSPLTETPDGVKDVHIRLTGVSLPISKAGITPNPNDGHWQFPSDGQSWIVSVRPESDPTVVDLYFDFWKQFASYNLALTLSDGSSWNAIAQ